MPTWLIFLLVLSVLVFVHEAGHFLAAKLLKIKVEEFAFGLPFTRALFSFKYGETKYSIYPMFFGGFVRMLGEESQVPSNKVTKSERGRDYWSRGKKQRLMVVMAGVVMNLVLALTGFWWLYSKVGVPVKATQKVTVVETAAGSPAGQVGIKDQDRIVAVEGKIIESTAEFGELMKSWAGIKVNLTIESGEVTPLFEGLIQRNTTKRVVGVVPRKDPPEGQGALGVVIAEYPYLITKECKMYNLQCTIGAVTQGFKSTGLWVGRVFDGLRSIGKSLMAGKPPEGMAGPVGIYQLTGLVAAEGFLPLLELVAVLSVNLAVFNVLPIPALDGGRALFIYLEYFLRRRIPAEVEQKVNSWGMMFLLGLMLLISLQDVWRLGILDKILKR